jgi:hypothetical protein
MSQELANCHDCYFSYQLRGCHNCIGCSNLANKEYYVFNKKVSKEEFENTRDQILNGSYATWLQGKEFFQKMWKEAKHRALHNINCENVSGDMLLNCKNIWNGFEGYDTEDVAYSLSFGTGSKNIWYSYSAGWSASELIYNASTSRNSQDLRFCYYTYDSNNLTYCDSCSNCKNCFGCIGLKHKQYCILNKQYTKEEYEKLVPRVIKHMGKYQEWGQLGAWFSSYTYNETAAHAYMPLSKAETENRGYKWKENIQSVEDHSSKSVSESKISLPDSVHDTDDVICQQTLACTETGKPYRVIKPELEFYRKMNLPLPRLCPEAQRVERNKRRSPYKLFERTCTQCQAKIQSTYAPDRPEEILCDTCHLKVIN